MFCCKSKKKDEKANYFRVDYRRKALTEKFYARHESFDFDYQLLNSPIVMKYVKLLDEKILNAQKNASLAPITENQKYGWLLHLSDRSNDPIDNSIWLHPRKGDSQIRLIAIITSKWHGSGLNV